MANNSEVWTIKHSPKKLGDVQGQNKSVAALQRFVEDFPKKKAALLYGPSGSGKSSAAVAIAKEYDLELIELNASDFRNEAEINNRVRNAVTQGSLFGKKKLILIDEIDGVSGTYDRGGVNAVAKIIDMTNYPIIITANNAYDRKLSSVRKKSEMIEFTSLRYTSINALLKKIADDERIEYEDKALLNIATRSSGDARSAIIDMQATLDENNKVTESAVSELDDRDRDEKIINALLKVFKTTSEDTARNSFDAVQENYDDLFLWVDENLPHEYKKPIDLFRAYERICRADVMRSRIRRRQHWRFLSYIYYYLTVGIATAKDEKYAGFARLRPTNRILKMWMSNNKRAHMKHIAEKLAPAVHESTKSLMKENIFYIKAMAKNNPEMMKHLTEEYDLEENEIAWLKK